MIILFVVMRRVVDMNATELLVSALSMCGCSAGTLSVHAANVGDDDDDEEEEEEEEDDDDDDDDDMNATELLLSALIMCGCFWSAEQ